MSAPSMQDAPHGPASPAVLGDPRSVHVNTLPVERNPLAAQEPELQCSLRDAPVRADDAMPRDLILRLREHAPNQAGRGGVDVAVGPHESLGDRSDAIEDAHRPLLRNRRASPAPGHPRIVNGPFRYGIGSGVAPLA